MPNWSYTLSMEAPAPFMFFLSTCWNRIQLRIYIGGSYATIRPWEGTIADIKSRNMQPYGIR